MKAYESALGSMGYFLLRYLSGIEYPEEVLEELEMLLNKLITATVEEVETFMRLLEQEVSEGSYSLQEAIVKEKLEELNCPMPLADWIIGTVAA